MRSDQASGDDGDQPYVVHAEHHGPALRALVCPDPCVGLVDCDRAVDAMMPGLVVWQMARASVG